MHKILKKYNNRENGFTLVELLIVVLIIGILAAIAIPVYLGVQTQAKHSAVQADANQVVKQVQVGLTEGALTIPTAASNTGITGYSDTSARSDGTTVTTTPLGSGQFQVQGIGGDGYSYTYDSRTGQFTAGTADVVLGGGSGGSSNAAPTITSAVPTATATVGTTYSYYVTATGTPTPTYGATGLPTGLSMNSTTGRIYGTPTTAGSYNYTITVTNTVSPDATQTGTITVSSPTSWNFDDGTTQGWGAQTGMTAAASSAYTYNSSAGSLKVAGTNTYTPLAYSAAWTTVPGKSYTFTAYVYLQSNASNAKVWLLYTLGNTNTSYVSTTGNWTQINVTFTANTTSSYIYLAASTNNVNITAYVDNATVTAN